jgi:DNA-binding transcriptional LysR family regulator
VAKAAADGAGIALLPCLIGRATPGLVQVGAPKPELAEGLWLLTHEDLRHTARVRAFMDFAATEIARQRELIEGEALGNTGDRRELSRA